MVHTPIWLVPADHLPVASTPPSRLSISDGMRDKLA
jgi:hypothetical protein